MNRTRLIFIAIIGVTFLIICVAAAAQVINNLAQRLSNGSETATTPEPTELPAGTILVTFANSNTKQNWIDQVIANFNSENHTTSAGNRIIVEVTHGTSGDSMNAILDGSNRPIAWSPGDRSWVEQLNDTWQIQTNRNLTSQACRPTVYAPVGFAIWKPMAETLGWPEPISWEAIVDLAEDPNGWASLGRPEWGQFRFGHTHPAYANSGLLTMTTFVYGIAGSDQPLTPAMVYDPAVEEAMRTLEQHTSKYGRQAPALLDLMARQGPSYLHAAAVPEAEVLRFNDERAGELAFPLVFAFPAGGTIWAEHPYCVLDNGDWVSDEQAEAANLFGDYLLADAQQELAIDNYLRPIDTTIALRAPVDMAHGTDPTITPAQVPALPSPDAQVSAAVIDLFQQTKRKATVIIVLDTSGSMQTDNRIGTATQATAEFLNRLDPSDEVAVITFSSDVVTLAEPSRVSEVSEGLSGRITGLIADGSTALYAAVCQAVQLATDLQNEDRDNGESRLYGIILLSDGEDTMGEPSENQMFATCLPTNAEADGIKIFPIALGGEADTNVLTRIANVTGGRLFTATPASIGNVYISISAEQ